MIWNRRSGALQRAPQAFANNTEEGQIHMAHRLSPIRTRLRRSRAWLAGALGALAALGAQAAQITSITPADVANHPRQVLVTLSEAVVPIGQPQATPPVTLQCDGALPKGQGRWLHERQWAYQFEQPLPGGMRCQVARNPQFRDLGGQPLAELAEHHFNTGGPSIVDIHPSHWDGVIEEEQYFLLTLNSPVDPASLAKHAWCQIEGVGERVALRVLPDQEHQQLRELLRESRHRRDEHTGPTLAVACQRRMSPGATLTLVWDKGMAAPNGVATEKREHYDYVVRQPFAATFSCARENAGKKCIPMLPMDLRFNDDVPMQWLPHIVLRAGDRQWLPSVELDEGRLTPEQWQAQAKQLEGRHMSWLRFDGPFPENTRFELVLPAGLQDDSQRALSNASAFPLQVATDAAPALAKFATGDFAIIERFAEGYHQAPLLPMTLRRVEQELPLRVLRLDSDAEIIEWMYRTEQLRPDGYVHRHYAQSLGLSPLPTRSKASDPDAREPKFIRARMVGLLEHQPQAQSRSIAPSPGNADRQATEVIGIPLEPGFQVIEVASPLLGGALLDPKFDAPRTLYARTTVLVTNLAVHFKLGAHNSLAWVTSLDTGKPVAGARVQVNQCDGSVVAQATTDAQGLARFDDVAGMPECERAEARYWHRNAYLVSARSPDGKDLALVWSDWQRGIEPWRFQHSYSDHLQPQNKTKLHTVLDRNLLRAGETVSMKHYARAEVPSGLATPATGALPDTLFVRHHGSQREFEQKLQWERTAGGGMVATSSLKLPAMAPLGRYSISLQRQGPNQVSATTAQFRVEEFRLPVLEGRITPLAAADGKTAEGGALEMALQLSYLSGGHASNWPVKISAMLEPHWLQFDDYHDYQFTPPARPSERPDGHGPHEQDGPSPSEPRRLLLDKQPLTLDAQGQGRFTVPAAPAQYAAQPHQLRIEANFEDPSGETQTITRLQPVWPSDVLVGIATEEWISVKKPLKVRAIALSPQGQPLAGQAIAVRARAHTTLSTRKRMVGGFYKYEHHHETQDLGTVCEGRSDALGRFDCTAELTQPGEIELVASVQDARARPFSAATSIWVTREGEQWFDADSSDRMDVLPEKPSYQPGETARFQVRMPYRQAQALLTVEREGVLHSQIIELSGKDPSFSLHIDPSWSPNVYVSVLALRGRLREVPWYSFFTWGFRSPILWWRAWRSDTGEAVPPTALVDLSKPSHRLGVAMLRVGDDGHRLRVQVTPDKPRYQSGETATLTLQAQLPDGQPAAHAEVALAVVDKALLELSPNPSWALLKAMMGERAWRVQTATAQMEVVGRRHYGRKAVAAGGGGGEGEGQHATRELFDTLLLWQPRIALDANGRASVQVPLNDSVTTFHAQAMADAGVQFFGEGSAELLATRDLQIISGLPPVVREGDRYDARLTLRNTTDQPLTVQVSARHGQQELPASSVSLAAGAAQTVQWQVTAPMLEGDLAQASLDWQLQAQAQQTPGNDKTTPQDSLRITQTLLPAVPVTVRQASLRQLGAASEAPLQLQVAMPEGALEGRGGIVLQAQSQLGGDLLPGLQRWWKHYPYACLEQRHSKAIGLLDEQLFQSVQADLPSFLDDNGLAGYFPPSSRYQGSVPLTAHLLQVDSVMQQLGMHHMRIDADSRQRMLKALEDFVVGRLDLKAPPYYPNARHERSAERLMALAALSMHGAAQPSMIENLEITPSAWSTYAVLDWLQILRNLPSLPQRAKLQAQAEQTLRNRLQHTGTQLILEQNGPHHGWWLMQNPDSDAARLLLLTADLPGWKDDAGALASALLARQNNGAWRTTTANLWGQLALRRFSNLHESEPVGGALQARLGGEQQQRDWPAPSTSEGQGAARGEGKGISRLQMQFAWPDAIARLGDGQAAAQLKVAQLGTGRPWLTISALAAMPLTAPVHSGLRVEKRITPVVQAQPGRWSPGDVYRVHLLLDSAAQLNMTVLTDPIPAGSTILGSGLGRDSAIDSQAGGDEGHDDSWWRIAWVERKHDAMRVYYHGLPAGQTRYSYTVRLNQPGQFQLPPTRAEALYMPQFFGETPNAQFSVAASAAQ
ncbi:alpha-2-macroglobulin [Vandammella animalimorsus]|uniref:Alpha-2-macroglobulin n=2 Tax=Vandammella animalimorsus TaxID=2029117 RepID=A0A2A2T6L6_9BURK|nr:alpha-2-macroglobulin [Vandammella animalimorsus]PAX17362.1 alpha-2-macroglobulin [Vandammella animalimorsus]PAX19418.1 alpha-2-macroglobulin [Vandammella animalimorsus]